VQRAQVLAGQAVTLHIVSPLRITCSHTILQELLLTYKPDILPIVVGTAFSSLLWRICMDDGSSELAQLSAFPLLCRSSPLVHVTNRCDHAAGNSAYVLAGSPGSTDRGAGSPAAAMLLPARDNPHRLFIRSPPPSTAAAANGSSLSPARGQAQDNSQTPVRWVGSIVCCLCSSVFAVCFPLFKFHGWCGA
jgi:hypothetical protein